MHTFILKITLAAVLATGATVSAYSQEYVSTPVTISKEKVKVNGKICYSHIVLEKQTLFSISKAYNVSVDEIYELNPSLKEDGLKKNAIILIPAQTEAEKAVKAEQKEEVKVEQKEEVKVEKEKETEKVTVIRPQKESQEKPAIQNKPLKIIKKPKQKTHTVKWYEDVDMIAEKYGISTESLILANDIKDRKLTVRQKLVIPEEGEVQPQEEEVKDYFADSETFGSTPADTADTEEKPKAAPVPVEPIISKMETVEATVLLPLKAVDGTSSRNNMDFYTGVLLAVYDMSEEGVSTNLTTYDIADGELEKVKDRVNESDIVIGPISNGDLARLLAMKNDSSAIVVSPLDPRAEGLTANQTSLVHAPAATYTQYEDMVKWIEEDLQPIDTVLFISEKGAWQANIINSIKSELDKAEMQYNTFSYSILEGRDIMEPLCSLMTVTGTNRVIVASESEAFVNDVVRNLNVMVHNKYSIVLYGPSKFRSFDTIEAENFHNTNFHASLSYHIDYENEAVRTFLKKYRALFNTEPTQFAYQGYDVTRFFITLCSKYGKYWKSFIDQESEAHLQSSFNFLKLENGGYVNKGIRRVVYLPDYQINLL